MSKKYLQTSYYEAVLPVKVGTATGSFRVWLDAKEIVPLLRQLDTRYGDEGQPYSVHAEERLRALHTLEELIRDLITERPEVLKRVCTGEQIAQALQVQYEVRRREIYPLPPPWLDQVDLEPIDIAPLLGRLFHRQANSV
ncbi:MAG TPA: hypothetical protein VH593_06280 [Ktedonobacteraceae bacterium]